MNPTGITKLIKVISVLNANFSSHLIERYKPVGIAMQDAIRIHFKNISNKCFIIFSELAPCIFLIPISFDLLSMIKNANPENPNDEISTINNAIKLL